MHPHASLDVWARLVLLSQVIGLGFRASAAPPEGAIVLFDGNDVAQWVRASDGAAPPWAFTNGVLTVIPGSGNIRTFQTFDDLQMHLEFRFLSNSPAGTAEGSLANSGVFLQNQFEIQIMESWNRPVSGANEAGAIYSIRDPSTNASVPGGSWETFDITFRTARWSGGVKTENARMTVYWNGVLVQDDIPIPRRKESGAPREEAPPGGIELQDLVKIVQFRNIWVLPLTSPRPPGPNQTTLIPPGAAWKYLDDGSDQGVAWRGSDFDDTGWSNGIAQFGYGDGDEATLVRSNRSDRSIVQTTYFRKAFVVTNTWAITNLNLGLLRDDGGVVYLNSAEIFRNNITNSPVYYTNWAPVAVSGADESRFFTTNVSPALLRQGTNILTVEIHQQSATSSDVSFDLWLSALAYKPPALTVSRTGGDIQLTSPALPGGFILESASKLSALATWSPESNAPVVVTNGFRTITIEASDTTRFFRLRR